MKIAMAQMNPTLGDFSGNGKKILAAAKAAKDGGADVVLFPEMSLFGYHPGDLLERQSVVDEQLLVLDQLVSELPREIVCLVGCALKNPGRGKPYYNSAAWIHKGKIQKTFHKELLPVYDVFDDGRHFHRGSIRDNFYELDGKKILILICEDMWGWDPLHAKNPIEDLQPGGYHCIVNLSASPFTVDKQEQRYASAKKTVLHLKAPLVYTNMSSGQDELIFDGGSFAMDAKGELLLTASRFSEDLKIIDLESISKLEQCSLRDPLAETEKIKSALVLGIRDYVQKIGFQKVHLGLSGGVDSAVVACLAAEAVGPKNLTCFSMPSKFNAAKSFTLAKSLCEKLGCEFVEMPIQSGFEAIVQSYEKAMGPKEFSLVHENIQARLRGLLLMAYANEKNSLLLTTGNKSEYAVGYTTLYGDMCGGLAVIGDLLKRQVFHVAEAYVENNGPMPRGIIDRPPSAELRPDQKDSDSLPDYDVLDTSVENLVCQKNKAQTLQKRGFCRGSSNQSLSAGNPHQF